MSKLINRWGGLRWILPIIIGGCVALTFPLYGGSTNIHIFFLVFLHIVLALSYRVFFITGLGSFCHIAFFGIGAYTSVLLALRLGLPYPVCFLAGGILAALIAAGLAITSRHTKGVYFFIISFAFYQIVHMGFKHWESMTGGDGGIANIPPIMGFTSVTPYYYMALAFAAVSAFILYRLHRSRFGSECLAIGEADDLAEVSGIDVVRYRIIAFAIGGLFAGFAGSIFAHYVRYISPQSFGLWDNLYILIWCIVGGERRFWGPIVGATMITLIAEILRATGSLQAIIYGAALVAVILVMPQGASGLVDTLRARWARA